MCYVTPDGTVGSAKSGIWASSQSGLLWFFDRGNAEVLVKVLDGCSNNGFRWVFVAPVTTLEFNLRVTGPYGKTWTHSNVQGETASTKSDVKAFFCTVDAAGLDFELDAENGVPLDITYARGYFYVIDRDHGKVFAYDGAGKRAASQDFPLDAENASPRAITYARGFFYVVDDKKVYGYRGDGGRSSSRDFSLGPRFSGAAYGLAYGDGFFWVMSVRTGGCNRSAVFAYDSAGVRVPSRDFGWFFNYCSGGIRYVSGVLHLIGGGTVYAYTVAANRVASRDFRLDPHNRSPQGIAYADGFFYVVDLVADAVFAYPEPGS